MWRILIVAFVVFDAMAAREVRGDGEGFAGAYAASRSWQPPKDPQALAKLRKFQDC